MPAEIVSIREQAGVHEFYIHYINYNRRLDGWVTVDRMNLKELAPPSSSGHGAHENSSTSQSRVVPGPTQTSAESSSCVPSMNNAASAATTNTTTTFFLSDNADSLNNELSRTATLASLTEPLPAKATAHLPSQVRGNGNPNHSGAHSVTKVKNINLIHLGRYFIKPWYFSPYPEVRRSRRMEQITILLDVRCRNSLEYRLSTSVNSV